MNDDFYRVNDPSSHHDFSANKKEEKGEERFERNREESRERESRERHLRATHHVLDLHYRPDEGQSEYCGTEQECIDWAATQTPYFMYQVVPLTMKEREEIKRMLS